MLDNILQNIEGKAKQEIEKALVTKQESLLALEQGFEQSFKEKKEAEMALLEQNTEKEIEEVKQEIKLANSFKLGRAKKKATREVYQKAVEKIVAFDDEKFTLVISKLFGKVQGSASGEIVAGSRSAIALKKVADPDVVIKEGIKEEGFVIKTKDLDVDVRISQVLEQNKEITDPKIMEVLF